MPITEIRRILARAPHPDKSRIELRLIYDVLPTSSMEEAPLGTPNYWLEEGDTGSEGGSRHGPFEDEDLAIDWAEARLGSLEWS